MKLVETDIRPTGELAAQKAHPPRPEHRRAYVSFFFTFSVLAATVIAIYTVFPARDNETLTVALATHENPGLLLVPPESYSQLIAWGAKVVGGDPPFPEPNDEMKAVGVAAIKILQRPVAMVRYKIGDEEATFFVTATRDTPPRRQHRRDGDLFAVTWRSGRWTITVVGNADSVDHWGSHLGIP